MFYYTINKHISNIYDANPLQIKGYVEVYVDETKENKLTEIPFSEIGVNLQVSDCPTDTADNFNTFVDNKVLEGLSVENVQAKLNEVLTLKNLGLI